MVDPIPDLAGARGFRFTGADQLFRVPPKITTVWLSGVGGAGAIGTRQFGQMAMRGFANAPLAVSPGDHIRVRVGGRPEIVGRFDDGLVDFEWKLSTIGGWNGGGNGGGTWGGDALNNPGRLHACGGGGATTFHLVPAGQNPIAVEGELVAVAPGQGGTVRGFYGAYGIIYNDGLAHEGVVLPPAEAFAAAGTAFAFAGDLEPPAGGAEFLGAFDNFDLLPTAMSTPPSRTWHTLNDPLLMSDGAITFSSQDVSLGNAGESLRGGHGRAFADAGATAGGGGGYGGGASGSRLLATGAGTITSPPSAYDATVDIAEPARHGGFLLPIDRPAGWDDGAVIAAGSTLATVEAEGVEAPLLYVSAEDPFAVYNFNTISDDPDNDYIGENPDTMLGHGSALIQWQRDGKRARWRVGHVGWGRNNGW